MVTLELYNQNTVKSQWCPGCGDFAVIKSLKEALVSLEIHPKDLVITAGLSQRLLLPRRARPSPAALHRH
jgi:2-oxoglutarate ferredoxin oxidoreductase subunit beta